MAIGAGSLDRKTAIITGGASGIGAASAELMAARGATIVIADIDADLGAKTAAGICARGHNARFVLTDVTSRSAVARLVSETRAVDGRIDVLVHVAAISVHAAFLELDDATWQRTLDVCLTGAFFVNQEVARVMVEQRGGRIVNIASTAALTGGTTHSAYSAAKAGVIALSKSMQRELASSDIVVMVVAPGATDTPLFRRNHPDEQERQAGDRPFGRAARPEEVASVVAYAASDESSHLLAGQTLHTNGGVFMGF